MPQKERKLQANVTAERKHKNSQQKIFLISICLEYLFPSPHFQSVFAPRSEVGLQ